jgi:hypothetical protein
MFGENISAQETLETQWRNVGGGILTYTGMTNIEDVRFLSLEFADYRGNPIAEFTITFATEEANVHAHSSNKIGDVTLTPANKYEQPSVREAIRAQGVDEQMVNNKARAFTLEGDIVGTTLDEINTAQAALVAEIENKATVVLTLSSDTASPGAYTVRSQRVEFGAPKMRDNTVARRYTYEAVTHDDYTKEPYTFGEVAQSFGGISLDVVKSVDHNTERDKNDVGPAYPIGEEKLIVQGKRYFSSYTAYSTFRDLFSPIPVNTYKVTSTSGNTLELTDVNVTEMQRDGNFSADNSKRYSAEVTLEFNWIKSYQDSTFEFTSTHFGVNWYEVESVTFGVEVNDKGHITSRSVNVSGTVLGSTNFDALKGKVGTSVDWDTTYNNLYVTSVGVNSVETIYVPGTGATKVYNVSASASQLDNASQAFHFLTGIFNLSKAGGAGTSYATGQFIFDNIISRTKSVSNRFNQQVMKFTVTSITISVSGEIFDNDSSGNPASPSKSVDLFNKIDALLNAEVSNQSGVNVHSGGIILPSNDDIHFMLNSVNIGGWDSFTDEQTGARRWKQSVSLSATAVFDLVGGANSQPDTVETRSENVVLEAPKYQQLQVVNFGTVFKRVGTTPEKLVVTYQIRWKDEQLYKAANPGGVLNFGADNVGEGTWRGSGKNVVTKDEQGNSGLVNRHIKEYTATEKLG